MNRLTGGLRAMEGVFAINKPAGISSAQVIRDVQRHFNPSAHFKPWMDRERENRNSESRFQKKRRSRAKQAIQVKMGHGGTLDPAATGVLILGIGKGTKSLQSFLECTKTYEAVVLFGAATDSYDGEGKVVGRKPFDHVTREKVEASLGKFRGKFMQKPPIFSALSVDGKRLYQYAREGREVPGGIEERPVDVESIELVDWFEGRSHEYRFPQEAPKEDKEVAEKLLAVNNDKQAAPAKNPEDAETAGQKRKRDADEPSGEDTVDKDRKFARLDAESNRQDADTTKGAAADAPEPSANPDSAKQTGSEQADATPDSDGSQAPATRLAITSSRGFYVRSLCHDLGQAVESFGFMARLVRVRQGDFKLGENVFEYADLEKGEDTWAPQIEKMLNDWNEKHESS